MVRRQTILIGELSRRSGVPAHTINFYVQEGLLPRPKKLNRTRASYSEEHLEWLEAIHRLQAHGYPLRLLKRAMAQWGHSARTLERLKGSGAYQAIPESGLGTGGISGIVREPKDLRGLVGMTGLSAEQVKTLELWGVLRPRERGVYDASDQELGVAIKRILDEGIPLEDLAFYRDFEPIARRLIEISHEIARRNLDQLRRREVGVRELGRPLIQVIDYLLLRTAFEVTPNLNEILLGEANFPERPKRGRGRRGAVGVGGSRRGVRTVAR